MRALIAVAAGLALACPVQALERREVPFELGDHSSAWAFDGECDDMRFTG